MNIEIEDRGGVKIAHFDGDLVGGEDSGVIDTIGDLLDDPSRKGVILELGEVPFITSAGLNELVQLAAKANSHQQHVLLANASLYVRGVLEATKLDRFFEVYATVDEAVDGLS